MAEPRWSRSGGSWIVAKLGPSDEPSDPGSASPTPTPTPSGPTSESTVSPSPTTTPTPVPVSLDPRFTGSVLLGLGLLVLFAAVHTVGSWGRHG